MEEDYILDGEDDYTTAVNYNSSCALCIHLDTIKDRCCPAFPDRIPDEIWFGENPHITPLADQENNITYKEDDFSDIDS